MQKATGMDLINDKLVASVGMLNISAAQNRGSHEVFQKTKEATKT